MNLRTRLAFLVLQAALLFVLPSSWLAAQAMPPQAPPQQNSLGYSDFSAEAKLEEKFMAVPDPKLAGEELKTLTIEIGRASCRERV